MPFISLQFSLSRRTILWGIACHELIFICRGAFIYYRTNFKAPIELFALSSLFFVPSVSPIRKLILDPNYAKHFTKENSPPFSSSAASLNSSASSCLTFNPLGFLHSIIKSEYWALTSFSSDKLSFLYLTTVLV